MKAGIDYKKIGIEYEKSDEEYVPKRNNRFIVEFEGLDIQSFLVQSVRFPSAYFNSKNKLSWENIIISFIDTIIFSSTDILYKFIKDNEGRALKENESLFNLKLLVLDPTGVVVEEWSIMVEKINYVQFGGYLNYGDDDSIKTIRMSIKPLDCILIK